MIANGWHKVPGDGTPGSPHARKVGIQLSERGIVWVRIVDGQIGGLTWCGAADDLDHDEMMIRYDWMKEDEFLPARDCQRAVEVWERQWGVKILDLLDPKPHNSWALPLGAVAILVAAKTGAGLIRRRNEKNLGKTAVATDATETASHLQPAHRL